MARKRRRQRQPRNAVQNLPGVSPDLWTALYGQKWEANVNPVSILSIPTYFRCLRILSVLPALLTARVVTGSGSSFSVIPDHPVAELFNRSFDGGYTSAFVDRCFAGDQQHRLGNAVGEILRNGRKEVAQIRWLERSEVHMYRDENREKRFQFALAKGQWSEAVDAKRVFHVPNYTLDGFIGRSAISLHTELLKRSMLSAQHRSAFFEEGGRPSGYLKKKGAIRSNTTKDEMRAEWEKSLPNGLAVLTDETEYIALALPPEDAKFLEGNRWDAVGICQIMGVPPYMAGILTKDGDIKAEELAIHFVVNTLFPAVRSIEAEATLKLLPPRYRLELDVTKILLGSLTAQAEYYTKMVSIAALNPDEVRESTGRAPIPNGIGSTPLVAGNNYVRLADVANGSYLNSGSQLAPSSSPSSDTASPSSTSPSSTSGTSPSQSTSSSTPSPQNASSVPSSSVSSVSVSPASLSSPHASVEQLRSKLSPETRLNLSRLLEEERGKDQEAVERSLEHSLN